MVKRLGMAAHIVMPTLGKLWPEDGKPGLSTLTFFKREGFSLLVVVVVVLE